MNNIILNKIAEQKIALFKSFDTNTIKVVADFDGTLSYGRRDDGKRNTSISVLRDGGYLPASYDAEAHALHDHYHTIEIDHTLSHEYRYKMMQEWWDRHNEIIIKYDLNKDILEKAGRSHYVKLRHGLKSLLEILKAKNIDIYIFSAGKRELIYYTLLEEFKNKNDTNNKENISFDESHIISNYFIYDKDGKVIDYNRPQITSFNKDESVITNNKFKLENEKDSKDSYSNIRDKYMGRRNVILIGDGEGDVNMVDEKNCDHILRIGFFNMKVEEAHYAERLAHFQNIYDIVITGDGSIDVALDTFDIYMI